MEVHERDGFEKSALVALMRGHQGLRQSAAEARQRAGHRARPAAMHTQDQHDIGHRLAVSISGLP
jgi:hypothetical protein